jgi:hypothetical protein
MKFGFGVIISLAALALAILACSQSVSEPGEWGRDFPPRAFCCLGHLWST